MKTAKVLWVIFLFIALIVVLYSILLHFNVIELQLLHTTVSSVPTVSGLLTSILSGIEAFEETFTPHPIYSSPLTEAGNVCAYLFLIGLIIFLIKVSVSSASDNKESKSTNED